MFALNLLPRLHLTNDSNPRVRSLYCEYGFPLQSQVGGFSGAAKGLPSQQIATVQPSHASPGSSGGLMSLLRVNVFTSTFHACSEDANFRPTALQ